MGTAITQTQKWTSVGKAHGFVSVCLLVISGLLTAAAANNNNNNNNNGDDDEADDAKFNVNFFSNKNYKKKKKWKLFWNLIDLNI